MVLNPKTTRLETAKALLTMAATLVLLGLGIVLVGGSRFWERHDEYLTRFTSVKDLTKGRDVKYQGLTIGKVRSVAVDEQDPSTMVVLLGVKPGFPLYQGVVARIAQRGLVGDYYIALQLESGPGQRLEPGTEIPTANSDSLEDLMRAAGKLLQELGPKLNNVASGMERLLSTQNTADMSRFVGQLPQLTQELRSIAANVQKDAGELSRTLGTTAQRATVAVERASGSLEKTLGNVDRQLAQVGGTLRASLEEIRKLAGTLDSDVETSNEQLTATMEAMESMSREIAALSRSLRERPWQVIYKPEEKRP